MLITPMEQGRERGILSTRATSRWVMCATRHTLNIQVIVPSLVLGKTLLRPIISITVSLR